jgi:hypothetical protein
MQLHEAWDILEAMKKLVDEDRTGQRVRTILEAHPQLVGAMLEIQRRLGMTTFGSEIVPVVSSSQTQMQQQLPIVQQAPIFQPPPSIPQNVGYGGQSFNQQYLRENDPRQNQKGPNSFYPQAKEEDMNNNRNQLNQNPPPQHPHFIQPPQLNQQQNYQQQYNSNTSGGNYNY